MDRPHVFSVLVQNGVLGVLARPRASPGDATRQADDERGPRAPVTAEHDGTQTAAPAAAAAMVPGYHQQSRPGVSHADLRREPRRKDTVQGHSNRPGSGQAQRHFNTAPSMRGPGRSLSPPPYPGGGDTREKVSEKK